MGVRSKRVRRSREEWQRIVGRFRSSGLTEAEFSRREGVLASTLSKWRRELGRAVKPTASADFVECSSGAVLGSSAPGESEMELLLPGGVVLRWKR